MNAAYGSSGSFGLWVRSKSIGHNTYTGRISHLISKPTQIYGLVHKLDLNLFYSRSHSSWSTQSFSKGLINNLYQKVSYTSTTIDTVINGFIPNELKSHLHICFHSIFTFGKIIFYSGFSNTYNIDSLDRSRKLVVDTVKFDISIFKKTIIINSKTRK